VKSRPVAVSKSEQKRIAEQSRPREIDWAGKKTAPPKNPRVPIFPPHVVPLVNLLNEIADKELWGDQERRAAALGVLTRLCVMWTPPHPVDWPAVKVDYVVETGLLHFDNELLRDTVCLMDKLFPNGEGLPEPVGAGPL